MRVLLTGATGFLGQSIVEAGVSAGLELLAGSRHPSPDARSSARPIRVDLGDLGSLREAAVGADVVIHAAGLAHVGEPPATPASRFVAVNVDGTRHLVQACADAGVRRVVLVSSVAVYGHGERPGVREDAECRPQTAYARSKRGAEHEATRLATDHDLDLVILRLATLYGPGDPGNVGRLIRAILRGRFVWVGHGTNLKSLLHRDDAARACLAAALREPTGAPAAAGPRIFNVSSPPRAMRDIVQTISRVARRPVQSSHVPPGAALAISRILARLGPAGGAARHLHGSLAKWLADDAYDGTQFEAAYGFKPEVDLEEGLRQTLAEGASTR